MVRQFLGTLHGSCGIEHRLLGKHRLLDAISSIHDLTTFSRTLKKCGCMASSSLDITLCAWTLAGKEHPHGWSRASQTIIYGINFCINCENFFVRKKNVIRPAASFFKEEISKVAAIHWHPQTASALSLSLVFWKKCFLCLQKITELFPLQLA